MEKLTYYRNLIIELYTGPKEGNKSVSHLLNTIESGKLNHSNFLGFNWIKSE